MPNAPYTPADRRPIAARRWRASHRAAGWLARRGVSPNAISLAGMACALAAGVTLAATATCPGWERVLWLTAAVLAPLRLAANMLDGMVAVESGRATRLGELFNEVPDRVSDAAILIGLGYARGSEPAVGYLAALMAVFTAYVRAVGKASGAPQFYSGPMAKPQRMWLVTAFCFCAAAAPDSSTAPLPEVGLTPPALALLAVAVGGAVTAARRLVLIRDALREPTA
ncbi:CDP-alcohol phosphatidyltransferase family protein [bacterium]|nr:CDP-alcohol phosphatidyltransferase family protein [bacterium]